MPTCSGAGLQHGIFGTIRSQNNQNHICDIFVHSNWQKCTKLNLYLQFFAIVACTMFFLDLWRQGVTPKTIDFIQYFCIKKLSSWPEKWTKNNFFLIFLRNAKICWGSPARPPPQNGAHPGPWTLSPLCLALYVLFYSPNLIPSTSQKIPSIAIMGARTWA